MINHKELASTLYARLKTVSGSIPVAVQGSAFTPTTGTLYLREFFLPGQTFANSIASGPQRMDGIYQIDVCSPVNAANGRNSTLAIVEQIKAGFTDKTKLTGLMIRATSVNSGIVDNGWFIVSISVNFTAIG